MSLATRCAACGTVFRVVQDQLKVSEGWVRCGRCGEVFSALEGLFDLDRENAPAWTPSQRGALEPPSVAGPPAAAEADDPTAGVDSESIDDTLIDTRADSQIDTRASGREGAEDAEGVDDDDADAAPWPGVAERTDEVDPSAGPAQADAAESALAPTPAFLRQAERDARWRTPRARALLGGAALALAVLLGAQWAVFERDALAARWPASAAALTAVCEALGCRIEPLRRLEGLAVESSGLTQLPDAAQVRLQVALRNRDTVALLTPALDLALTDSRGEVVVRKVLRGSDFGAATPEQLPPGGEVNLQAVLDTGDRRVAGYSVEIFYP